MRLLLLIFALLSKNQLCSYDSIEMNCLIPLKTLEWILAYDPTTAILLGIKLMVVLLSPMSQNSHSFLSFS